MMQLAPQTPCPVCDCGAHLFDVVDFHKNCEELRGKQVPLSGRPIYYARCQQCGFVFAPEFFDWSESEFLRKIYNDEYVLFDPDYADVRPRGNAKFLNELLGSKKEFIRHLDYGGGNGALSDLLSAEGWNSTSYDPFPQSDLQPQDLGTFDLITAFEVFEHMPRVKDLMANLKKLMKDDAIVLFSTLTSDGHVQATDRLNWWYASPRNGHVSLFSKNSLAVLGSSAGLRLSSFNAGLHCFFDRSPPWAAHLFK